MNILFGPARGGGGEQKVPFSSPPLTDAYRKFRTHYQKYLVSARSNNLMNRFEKFSYNTFYDVCLNSQKCAQLLNIANPVESVLVDSTFKMLTGSKLLINAKMLALDFLKYLLQVKTPTSSR